MRAGPDPVASGARRASSSRRPCEGSGRAFRHSVLRGHSEGTSDTLHSSTVLYGHSSHPSLSTNSCAAVEARRAPGKVALGPRGHPAQAFARTEQNDKSPSTQLLLSPHSHPSHFTVIHRAHPPMSNRASRMTGSGPRLRRDRECDSGSDIEIVDYKPVARMTAVNDDSPSTHEHQSDDDNDSRCPSRAALNQVSCKLFNGQSVFSRPSFQPYPPNATRASLAQGISHLSITEPLPKQPFSWNHEHYRTRTEPRPKEEQLEQYGSTDDERREFEKVVRAKEKQSKRMPGEPSPWHWQQAAFTEPSTSSVGFSSLSVSLIVSSADDLPTLCLRRLRAGSSFFRSRMSKVSRGSSQSAPSSEEQSSGSSPSARPSSQHQRSSNSQA